MSDTPVIFKRTKVKIKTNQRAREESVQDAQEQKFQSIEDEQSPSAIASKFKNKARHRAKPKPTLSFGAEQESNEESFEIKKSSLSQKLTLRQHPTYSGGGEIRTLPSSLDQASVSSLATSGPVYDETHLNELRANTPSSRSSRLKGNAHDDDSLTNSESGDLVMESLNDFDARVAAIPSQSFVLAAKEKRERLRTSGVASPHADEYISLSLAKRDEEYQGPHPESRLMREEDDLGEGDDDFAEYTSAQTRITLGKKARKVEAGRLREEMQDLIADAEEVDEETQEWEQAQLRRSGLNPDRDPSAPTTTPIYKPMPIPTPTEIPSLDSTVKRISQVMASLVTAHAQNTTSISTISADLVQLDDRETELREIITRAEKKRSWFADFREWLESVATFLDEKFPQLEQLEDEHVSILKERRDMIRARRRAENEDDLSMFLGPLPVAPQAGPGELDEMGRILPRLNPEVVRDDRQSARAARCALRRKNARQDDDEEGYSTDATLPPSDAADFLAALGQLSRKRDEVLSDVMANEFKDPGLGIGLRFAGWRKRFDDSYTGAWGGLGLVGAWEFWARLEMLGWNPFEDLRTLDSFHWYNNLYKYSRPTHSEEEEEPQLGPDGDLVSAVISTVVIPRLSKLIEGGALDPFSSNDTRRAVDLTEEIEVSVERNNHRFQILWKIIYGIFQDAVNDMMSCQDPFLAQDKPPFHPEAISARRRLLARQGKLMTNILQWRRHTNSMFGIDEIVKSLLVNCMLPVAKTGWEVGGEVCIRRVAQQFPIELATPRTKAQLGISDS
ncbi:GCFC-domain-containing protein [Multifurca ochricompacta]|uniref:GCFC-domain-containing protein n=1 Tax=Multifurca ochricompacta TaxID=376703 RepID=A0AAD4QQ52_9AGAM|nr:GCFC-domain-containing protein [Multifurca ochricompacta]